MRGISQLRRGRRLQARAKRQRLRRSQPRFAGGQLRSAFKAAPRKPRPRQPYLASAANLGKLV